MASKEEIRRLLIKAPNYQGRHSEIGLQIAVKLGCFFPLRMPNLELIAADNGLDPNELWPWLKKLRTPATTKEDG